MHNAPQPDLDPDELDLIGYVVRDFLSTRTERPGFEFDDLVQECTVHWWQQRERFDERRGATRSTYLRRVVMARLRDTERDRNAKKRGGRRRPASLDAPSSADPSSKIGYRLADPGRADLDWPVILHRVIDRLSQRERAIIAGLESGFNKSELSRLLKISRDTLHRDVKRIREVFRDEGLGRHLG